MLYRYFFIFIICAIASVGQVHAYYGNSGNFWGQGSEDLQIYYADKKPTKKTYPNPHHNPAIVGKRATDLNSPNLSDNAPTMVRYGKGGGNVGENESTARSGVENYHSWRR